MTRLLGLPRRAIRPRGAFAAGRASTGGGRGGPEQGDVPGLAVPGVIPTFMSPGANWESEISQKGQEAKQSRSNPGSPNESRRRIGAGFVASDASAKSLESEPRGFSSSTPQIRG